MREDWIECKVESVSEYLRGITYKKENASDKELNGMFPILRANNIKDDKINFDELVFVDKDLINSNQILRKNDILFAMSSGSINLVGKSAFINDDLQFSFGAFCGVLRPNPYINAKYLSSYFSSLGFKNYISTVAKGSNINNLKREHLLNIQLPIPPLPEQRAIVKKIDSLFSSLDAGVADLKKAQQQLKIYRQAVLKKAFEGELTNIQEKPDVVSFEGEIQIVSGNTPKDLKTAEKIGDLPFYKVSDMNLLGNEIYMSNSNIFLSRTQFHKMKLKTFPKGTIIFPKRGGAILTNKKRILSQDSTFDLNLMGIIPNENFSSKYLYYYFYKMDLAKIADGSAVPQINNKNINPLQIQKYSIDEQKEIVKQIESRLSVCDSIEQNIKESLEKAEALRQSILKKAFEGNLLTAQELAECKLAPDYEPASVLLERIKAEQTEIKAKPSKKKPRHSVAKSQ